MPSKPRLNLRQFGDNAPKQAKTVCANPARFVGGKCRPAQSEGHPSPCCCGKLSLSLDEGARLLHLSKNTVRRALEELQAKGFVALIRRGRWFGRKASEWRVTDRGCNGYPASHDWKRWQPGGDLRPLRPNPENEVDAALAEMRDDSNP